LTRASTIPATAAPPQAKHWQDWADEYLAGPLGDFLDFGCGPGTFLARVAPRCARVVGIDMDEEKLAEARARVPQGEFHRLIPNTPLPFADRSFDNISILEVIEHVPRERPVLRDLARVLKPGGRLLLTTPHRGLLTFLDPGNVKFFVPWFHKFVHYFLLRNRQFYDKQFGSERRADGMIGDFAVQDRAWHRHYRLEEIRRLAPPELVIERCGVYFPYFRALSFLRLGLWAISRGKRNALPPALARKRAEFSTRRGWAGDQLVILFRRA
jgi:SAM-dependent methyltransferase